MYYFYFLNKNVEVISNYLKVENWYIKTTFLSDWKIIWDNQINLSFQTNWSIKEVYKKVWDWVKTWEKIASIDDIYLSIDLEKAQINLQTSYANLEAKENSLSKENITLAKKDLDYQKSLLDNSKTQLSNEKLIIEKI